MSVTKTKVTLIGAKPVEYKILPATIVAFEQHFAISLGEMKTMEQMYWIAWHAEDLANKIAGKARSLFEDWLNMVEDVEDVPTDPKDGAAKLS